MIFVLSITWIDIKKRTSYETIITKLREIVTDSHYFTTIISCLEEFSKAPRNETQSNSERRVPDNINNLEIEYDHFYEEQRPSKRSKISDKFTILHPSQVTFLFFFISFYVSIHILVSNSIFD